MKISVMILSWNNADVMKLSIPIIFAELKGMDFEIVFVDNGSTDGTKELIKSWIDATQLHNINCFSNKVNRGISIGKNQGINACIGEHVLMLDGDVCPVPNSIRLMSKFLDDNIDKHAIGMYPNKFSDQPNKGHLTPCEVFCDELYQPMEHNCTCLFYGMYRRIIFDEGLRMNEKGAFGEAGYGWEDHDFFKRMQQRGIKQYVAHINNPRGRYYHKINSSIRAMGDDAFRRSMQARSLQFKEIWNAA